MSVSPLFAYYTPRLGDPPTVKGVPLLRFFWEPVIDLYGEIASTFFKERDGNESNPKFNIAGHETSILPVDGQEEFDNNNPFLHMILEIVLALQRLVDSEMVSH